MSRPATPRRAAGLGSALLLLAAPACQTNDAGRSVPSPAAAQIEGETITLAELDAWIGEQLFQRETRRGPSQLYQVRSRFLDRLIDERVLAARAAERGVEPEALVRAEVQARGGVDEREIQTFYTENQAQFRGAPLDDVRPQIHAFLEGRRMQDVVSALREDARVVVQIEPPRLAVSADGPAKGPADAPVTIVEFSDFQCPYCRRVAPVVSDLIEKYPGQLRVVYRHLPLDHIHPQARAAAEASLCADDQGQFWGYHDAIFANPRALGPDDLARYAEDLGLDVARFRSCVSERTFRAKVDADSDAARAAGITGTPAFVINGILLSGAQPPQEFHRVIDAELAARAAEPEG